MSVALRLLIIAFLAALLWPKLAAYRAEWMLAQANTRLDRVLRGVDQGTSGMKAVEEAALLAHQSALLLPSDPRPALLEGIALILHGEGATAIAVLDDAIAKGERPELTLNLGRARTIVGDTSGANAAYLRTAWASPAALATLPKAMRETLQAEVLQLEIALRAGQLYAPPPL